MLANEKVANVGLKQLKLLAAANMVFAEIAAEDLASACGFLLNGISLTEAVDHERRYFAKPCNVSCKFLDIKLNMKQLLLLLATTLITIMSIGQSFEGKIVYNN